MSARDEFEKWADRLDDSEVFTFHAHLNATVLEAAREAKEWVLREATAKIRAEAERRDVRGNELETLALFAAADLIDPDPDE